MNERVPPDGPVQLGPVGLPEGRAIPEWGPLLWATSGRVPRPGRAWLAVSQIQAQTGLVPILLAYLHGNKRRDKRPWDSGELRRDCGPDEVDQFDAAAVLASSWDDSIDPDDDDPEQLAELAPFSMRFPGLAPPQDTELSQADLDRALDSVKPARLGLVPAPRPADVLGLVGFHGTGNRYDTPAQLSAVLRSWEDRFGAMLLEVGYSHIRLLVRRPPRTQPAAQAAAAEIWAMCDEFWTRPLSPRALTTVTEIADYIAGAPFWTLWLD
jgi:Domain of unknown function (DUF4253)